MDQDHTGMGAAQRRHRSTRSKVSSRSQLDPIAETLQALTSKSGVAAIRDAWRRRLREDAPPVQSADLLLRLFAWRLQVEAYGGLDETTALRLNQLSRAATDKTHTSVPAVASLETGTILVREWRNKEHRVLVLDNAFEHEGKRYESLSKVARAITGTRWSGPRFFGIEQAERSKRASEGGGTS